MDGSVKITDPKLEKALDAVRSDRKEAEKFAADPQGYLAARGISTDGLRFTGAELSDNDLQQVAGGVADASVCASVGCVACVSAGTDAA